VSGSRRLALLLWLALPQAAAAIAQEAAQEQALPVDAPATPPSPPPHPEDPEAAGMRNGLEIYRAFRDGLAEPECNGDQGRWRRHFAHAPRRLADPGSDALPLFGYVVDALREAGLPTEFALIPFVESGYAPGARSRSGPAGLWQFIGTTARHHGVPVGGAYDGRLSPAESTTAAVRYLGTLNGMFDGNWRLAAMAYNAGEQRVRQALRRSGADPAAAGPAHLPGLSPVTYAYVEKLHALACVLEEAGKDAAWLGELDRPVLHLHAHRLEGATHLAGWAQPQGHDPELLRRLNPALASAWPRGQAPLALIPRTPPGILASVPTTEADGDAAVAASSGADGGAAPRIHTVRSGESVWQIARRYGMAPARLIELNGLGRRALIRPGMVLRLD
jgi:Predicted soluble lytic transglycosylase fused to an ABC-type amino acid-binding protein